MSAGSGLALFEDNMRTLFLALLAIVGTACGCASVPQAPSFTDLKATTLRLEFDNGVCSGTAVGPSQILTATHCMSYGTLLRVNGHPVTVVGHSDDKKDHAIASILGLSFNSWAKFGATPNQGDRVRFWGSPKGNRDTYREGYVAHVSERVIAVSMMVCKGDSGAGLFDDKGELVGMVSAVTVDSCLFGIAFRS